MKIRNGFVSNSSSSSFIISTNDLNKNITITIPLVDFFEMMMNDSCDSTFFKVKTLDNLEEVFYNKTGEDSIDGKIKNKWNKKTQEEFKKFKKIISSGEKQLCFLDVSHIDRNLIEFLENPENSDKHGYEILEEEEY